MAKAVNKRFVLILAGSIVGLFGMAAGAYLFVQLRSGERSLRAGDRAAAQGDYETAARMYAKAVFREQANLEWLRKWRDAVAKQTPRSLSDYRTQYVELQGITGRIAVVARNDIEAHLALLRMIYTPLESGGGSFEEWNVLANEARSSLRFFDPDRPAALQRYLAIGLAAASQSAARFDADRSEEARRELEEAIRNNPKDAEVAALLAGWHLQAAARAREAGRPDEVRAALEATTRTIADLVAADPSPLIVRTLKLSFDLDVALRSINPQLTEPEQIAARRKILTDSAPRLAELHEAALRADSSELSPSWIARFERLSRAIEPARASELTLALIERAIAGRSDDALLKLMRADTLAQLGRTDDAAQLLEQITQLANPPVSFEGLRLFGIRARARFLQANIAATDAIRQRDSAQAKAALDQAVEFRRRLAAEVPEDSAQLRIVDARLALARRDLATAQTLLESFLRSPGDAADQVVDAQLLLADVSLRLPQPQPGRARELLREVDQARPGVRDIIFARGEIELQLNNRDEARRLFQRVLEIAPGDEAATRQLRTLDALAGGDAGQVQDPVMRVLVEAERVARGGAGGRDADEPRAIQILERGLEANAFDQRILEVLVRTYLTRNEGEKARAVVDRAARARPADENLKRLAESLAAVETLDGTLKLIDGRNLPAVDAALAKFEASRQFGDADRARGFLDEAIRAAPEDPRIIELTFQRALDENRLDEAQRLADLATQRDADRVGGDTFRARLLLARNNPREAINVLQRIVDRGAASVGVHRLLGTTLMDVGRSADGIRALRRALDLSPNDLGTTLLLTRALGSQGQLAEALAVARRAEPLGRNNPAFLDLWLGLEAAFGDRTVARQRREQVLQRTPSDLNNVGALAELRMLDNDWDGARTLIDRLKTEAPDLRTTALEARWFADRGNLRGAVDAFNAFIESQQKAGQLKTPDAHVVFAQFLMSRNQPELALRTLAAGKPLQDPKVRGVDLITADTLLTLGQFEQAEAIYRDLLSGGIADPQRAIAKRLIETLVQQQKWTEAEQQFAALGDAADADVEILMQRSQTARGLGDRRRARELLDRAVARFPDEPMTYVRRARLLLGDPTAERDVLDDLDTALRLRPGMWQALRTRASVHAAAGRRDQELRDLQAAVDANPRLDALRTLLISQLLRDRREADAFQVAEAGLQGRTTDLAYLTQMGQIFSAAGAHGRAARFLRDAWRQSPDVAAGPYVAALLASSPPNFREAEAVLAQPGGRIDANPQLLLIRASIRLAQRRDADARGDVRASLAALPNAEPATVETWYAALRQVFPRAADAVSALQDARAAGPLEPWLVLLRGRTMVEDAATRAQGISMLEGFVASSASDPMKLSALRSLSQAYAAEQNWERFGETTSRGLALAPTDAAFKNNAAYVLLVEQKKPQDALPLAQQAAELAPGDPNVLDTLAAVQWTLGQRDDALRNLSRAVRRYPTDLERAGALLKLGRWQLEADRRDAAAVTAGQLQELLVDDNAVRESLADEIGKFVQQAQPR